MSDHNINNERIPELVLKYLLRQLTDSEQIELDQWRTASAENEAEFVTLTDRARLQLKLTEFNQVNTEGIWEKIKTDVPELDIEPVNRSKYVWFRIAIAAAVLAGFLIGRMYVLNNNDKKLRDKNIPVASTEVFPAGNKAILTLANGSKIILDSASNGAIAKQERTIINKMHEGELVYSVNPPKNLPGEVNRDLYNTVSTPRGGKYQITLPDGSKAWLNAASALRFPVSFIGNDRNVELNGEAYFEVVPDKSKPFKVKMISSTGGSKGEITVLGTHFNANAYEEEPEIKVTLLEGLVKISNSLIERQGVKYLKPGEQAILNRAINEIAIVSKDNPESAIAWINGRFAFDKISFASMMRELSRWYNVDVIYDGPVPNRTIIGVVDRTMPFRELLATLEKMGNTHFVIEGRTVRVKP